MSYETVFHIYYLMIFSVLKEGWLLSGYVVPSVKNPIISEIPEETRYQI